MEFDDFIPYIYMFIVCLILGIILCSIWREEYKVLSTMIIIIISLHKIFYYLSYRNMGDP